jgi:hypothetical protein
MPKSFGLEDWKTSREVQKGSSPTSRERPAPVDIDIADEDKDWPRTSQGGRPHDDWGLEDWTT